MASREEYERLLEEAKELASAGDWSGAAGLVQDIASSLLESPFKEAEEPRLEESGLSRAARVAGLMSDFIVPFDEPKLDVRTGGARTPSMKKAVETGIEELGLILGLASDFMVPFESPALEKSVSAAGDIRPWLAEMGEQDIEAMETLAGEPEVGSDLDLTKRLLELPTDRPALIHAGMIKKFESLQGGAVNSGIHRGLMLALYWNDGRPLVADDLQQDELDFLGDEGNLKILNEYYKAGLFAAPRVGDETRDEFREMLEETGRTGLPDTRSREERVDFPSF